LYSLSTAPVCTFQRRATPSDEATWNIQNVHTVPCLPTCRHTCIQYHVYQPAGNSNSLWSWSLLERPLNNFPALMKHEGSSPHSQELSTGPYPEPDQLYSAKSTNHEAPRYAIFSIFSKYPPQHPVLKHPQSMFLP
jgi:hypothetical protein